MLMLERLNISLCIKCVCMCVSVLMPQRQCVKAVREHQVPKIDTPHWKEKEGEKEGETEEEEEEKRGMAG